MCGSRQVKNVREDLNDASDMRLRSLFRLLRSPGLQNASLARQECRKTERMSNKNSKAGIRVCSLVKMKNDTADDRLR